MEHQRARGIAIAEANDLAHGWNGRTKGGEGGRDIVA
jgi:hypothetical protein